MGLTVERFAALGLDQPPLPEVNGRGMADFIKSLRHPGDDCYHPCPEASPGPEVVAGKVTSHRDWRDTQVYEGTTRDIFIYTTPDLKAGIEAALAVFNDGAGYLSRNGPVR